MAKAKWAMIGHVSVDSGRLLLTDYLDEPEVKGYHDMVEKANYPKSLQLNFQFNGRPGAGVVFSTGLGDGTYPVFAKIERVILGEQDMGERITEIRVRFY